MKINKKDFLSVLDSVKPCVGSKEQSMQLTSFVFKDGFIYTYNDEMLASNECPQITATFAVQANEFHSFISKIKDVDFEANVTDTAFVIRTKRSTAEIVIEKEIKMPIEDVQYTDSVLLPPDFSEALKLVLPATSKDMSKPLATCVHLIENMVEAADVTCVARYTFEEGSEPFEECLIPEYSAKIIAKYDPSGVSYETGWVHFHVNGTLIISCRTQFSGQEYPNVGEYIDVEGTEIDFPVDVIDAIDRCGVFTESTDGTETTDKDRPVSVFIESGTCSVHGEGAFGKYRESTKMNYKGDEIKFTTDPSLLKTAITSKHKFEICENFIRIYNDAFVFLAAIQRKD